MRHSYPCVAKNAIHVKIPCFKMLFHLQDIFGAKEQHLQLRHPGQNVVKYTMHMGDEPILAAMAVFYPDILGLQGAHLCRTHHKSPGDSQDPHDETYLFQTQSRQEQVLSHHAPTWSDHRLLPLPGYFSYHTSNLYRLSKILLERFHTS